MVDVHSKEIRRKNMQAIKKENTFIEIRINNLLKNLDIPFNFQIKELPGKPDFVIEQYKAIIFVHGCFWHKHNCNLFKLPNTNTEFWLNKINDNCKRDTKNIQKLAKLGWKILIIWECALKGKFKLTDEQLIDRIEEWLCSHTKNAEIDTEGLKKSQINLQ